MKSKIYLILIIIIVVMFVFMFLRTDKNNPPDRPILTNEIALFILKDDLFFEECRLEGVEDKYKSCVVNISQDGNQWVIAITYDGLYDDSVKASRVQTTAIYKEGKWIKSDILRSQQCWPGRGHEDFSSELCI